MTNMFKRRSAATYGGTAALVVALAVLAGCGGGSAGSYGGSSGAPSAKASNTASIALAHSGLGTILVNGQGRTLYLFKADKGTSSACAGACASSWPPLTTADQPKAGSGVAAAKLGTTKRGDGTAEVTYNGHPLYTYAGDSAPGQTAGQGIDDFGAEWYALSPAGTQIGD
jgi:predicted lipoprotein with Yx(FWY)xxD motif